MTRRRLVGTVTAIVCVAAVCVAADARAQTASTAGVTPSPVFGLMQGLVGLVIVVGLIFAAGWLMKKIGPRTGAGSPVQVVGGTSVGPREKVVVVRFAGRTLLLGVAPGQVSLLDVASGTDVVDANAPDAAPPTFGDRLRAARGRA